MYSFALEVARLKSEVADQVTSLQQTLSNFSDRLDDVTLQTQERNPILDSCADLLPSSPSGYYLVRASNGFPMYVYCDMTWSCGGITGGWMRVAELDMTNSSHLCPSGLIEHNDSNIRTCARESKSAGCSSVMISVSNINYASVCGRVIAYQSGSPDAFYSTSPIDSFYVDGVSLTHGSPREHIWQLLMNLLLRSLVAHALEVTK